MGKAVWHEFDSGARLAEALSEAVSRHLAAAVAERGQALIAVSGGGTPPPFLRALSQKAVDWQRVTVTLVDERFVPPSSERSNARLAARHLLQNEAARADFVGLYHELDSVEEAAEKADRIVGSLPLPLDVAVLGMGTDGHTASFFPDAKGLSALLNETSRRVLPVHAPSAREPRLTLSMPVLCGARFLAVHIEGEEKRTVLEAALAEKSGERLPVRLVMDRAAVPVHIYWAPSKTKGKPVEEATL